MWQSQQTLATREGGLMHRDTKDAEIGFAEIKGVWEY